MTYYIYIPLQKPFQHFGEFVGYDEKVPDVHARAFVERAFHNGKRLLESNEVPDILLSWTKASSLPPVFCSLSGIIVVQNSVRILIDQADPGCHQFIPIKVVDGIGNSPAEHCYILNVYKEQDSIVDNLSEVRENTGSSGGKIMHISRRDKPVVAINVSNLSELNLWREKRYPGSMFISDSLFSRFKENRIAFFKPRKLTDAKIDGDGVDGN